MLTFRFNGKCGKMEVPEKLVSGTIGKQVLFEFSSDWNELKKTAVFMALDGSSHAACSVEVSQELLTIPAVVLENPEHTLYVQIQGYSADGTEVINTGRVQGPRIIPGIDPGELPEIDGSNPIWFDIRNQIGDLGTLQTDSKSTLVSAINELALGKGKRDLFQVALRVDDEDHYSASASYMEIAQAKDQGKLVLLRYGVYITHILAGEPTESSFLFEPLLHSVPGIHGYTVDIQDNWSAAPVGDTGDGESAENRYETVIFGVSDGDAVYNAVMSGKPVYCLLDDLYHLPMIDCREDANIAVFGGCYDDKIITCEFMYGGWTVKTEKIGTDVYALMTKAISDESTDGQVPTAKAVYDAVKGKLDSADLSNAVNYALLQAKESGEFDGEDGVSPTVELEARNNGIAISVSSYQPGIGMAGATYLIKHGENGHTPVKGVDYLTPTSDSTEQPSYGTELATSSGWTATGWAGDFASGFTHTSGNTSPLIFTMPEDTGTNIYRISFKCSTSIAVEALMVKCGNSDLYDLYGQAANPIIIGIQSVSNGNIEFVPASGFTGTITEISIKRVLSAFDSEYMITDSNGEVAVEVRATKASQNNLFIGKNSGRQNISGYGCAGFGANALESNTSGFWNVGIGCNALQNNTVGSRNVGIGYIALQSNITGTRNVAIGSFALWHNTTGNKNIAIGADSLDGNVSGSENVAIGLQALYSNVSGNFNTAVGSGALTKNTGNNNTAVGKMALSQCTSGSNNVGLGYNAGTAITTGADNLAIGTNSLYKLKTGKGNIGIGTQAGRGQGTTAGFKYGIFIGNQAGYSLANDADYNIMVGYQAGYSATTGDNNIFIGNKAGYNTTTGYNCILIGTDVNASADYPNYWLNIGNLIEGRMVAAAAAYARVNGTLEITNLATSDPGIAGRLWNDNGTVKVSAG